MSDCRSSYRAATLLHGQLSFCRQYSFASVLPCSSIYAARQSERQSRGCRVEQWIGVGRRWWLAREAWPHFRRDLQASRTYRNNASAYGAQERLFLRPYNENV